jgi:autotransporter adhesin
VALGDSSLASAPGAVAVGLNAAATGTNAIAIGTGAMATGSIAVGAGASAANGGAAFGDGAVATGSNATAIGPGASATFANSSAFGAGATATAANQMVFGTRATTYVAPGITSAASLAAQSGPTNFVTSDSAGHLATASFGPSSISNMFSNVASLQSNVASLQSQIQTNQTEARRGIATAMAMNGYMLPSAPGKFTVQVSGGFFEGQSAAAATFAYRFNTAMPAVLFGSVGNGGGNEWGGKVGLGVELN